MIEIMQITLPHVNSLIFTVIEKFKKNFYLIRIKIWVIDINRHKY